MVGIRVQSCSSGTVAESDDTQFDVSAAFVRRGGARDLAFNASLLCFPSKFAAFRSLTNPFRQPQQCSS
jgi:hypothetical protein